MLDIEQPTREPTYDKVLGVQGTIKPAALGKRSVSRLLLDSMGLAAWKTAQGASWPLRINPSSGNLHPTESYLLCGSVKELSATPMVCHYAPKEHSLEVRAEISRETWMKLTEELPTDSILIGLTSIHWRESWKYGERAYRYCQLDIGHALAALSLSAAALGWKARLVDKPGRDELATLLGVAGQTGYNAEEPDCLLVLHPNEKGTGSAVLTWMHYKNSRTCGGREQPTASVLPRTTGNVSTRLPGQPASHGNKRNIRRHCCERRRSRTRSIPDPFGK